MNARSKNDLITRSRRNAAANIHGRSGGFAPGFAVEPLENRTLLSDTPLPLVSELTNPSNTVVRFETNFGTIDLELFDSQAPITVANVLGYVRDGDYDQSFFHRVAKQNGNDPFVIQGGGFRLNRDPVLTDPLPFRTVPLNDPILNEFNQSNLQRTISMARVGGQVNSATSQFFFNMANNTFLDSVDQGFTVFGRVLNDSSWAVLQTIDGLDREDIDSADPTDPFGEVPLSDTSNLADGIQNSDLVVISDAEIIKPANVAGFYTHRYYFPEGFASNRINEFVPIQNPGGSTVYYQIIVRAEREANQPADGADFWFRDRVIATNSVPANFRSGITVSRGSAGVSLVDPNTPFAYELWATGPLSANLSHYDNGAATGESFTDEPALEWTITDLRKGGANRDFVLWQNLREDTANITITFYFTTGQTTFDTTTQGLRRGGFNVNTFGTIPDGNFSIKITSDQPLVASMTHFFIDEPLLAFQALGIRGDARTQGLLPLASRNSGAGTPSTEEVTFLNTGSAVSIITLIFSFDDGSPDITITPAQLFVQPGRRATFNLDNVAGLNGKRATLRYSSGANAVYASTRHTELDDDLGTAFFYSAALRTGFAEGFMVRSRAGNNLFETISVYNPYTSFFGVTELDADVTLRFIYNDGTVVTEDFTLAGGERMDVDLHLLETVLEQSDMGRRFFSIEVVSTVPVVAGMRHYDLLSNNRQAPGGFAVTGIQRGVFALSELGMFS